MWFAHYFQLPNVQGPPEEPLVTNCISLIISRVLNISLPQLFPCASMYFEINNSPGIYSRKYSISFLSLLFWYVCLQPLSYWLLNTSSLTLNILISFWLLCHCILAEQQHLVWHPVHAVAGEWDRQTCLAHAVVHTHPPGGHLGGWFKTC